jgi:hypothetical protein
MLWIRRALLRRALLFNLLRRNAAGSLTGTNADSERSEESLESRAESLSLSLPRFAEAMALVRSEGEEIPRFAWNDSGARLSGAAPANTPHRRPDFVLLV